MIAISRPLIGVSALIAIGIVAVDMAQSRTQETAASVVSARFPKAYEMMVGLGAIQLPEGIVKSSLGKSDRSPTSEGRCVHEHWPHISDECLVTNGTEPAPRPSRTITIERRVADIAGSGTGIVAGS
jgi:hypothetical protein